MLWNQRRSISPQNKENLNQQVITRRRESKISNRYENKSQLTILNQIKQPKIYRDPLFDETLWKCSHEDMGLKLFRESLLDRTVVFKELYVVGKQIGSGSYASVRLCADKLTLKSYALKIYNKQTISSSRKKSILREIRILQMIKHPNVIQIYDVVETNNHVNLVLELIESKPLTSLNQYHLKQALFQIASGLNYLHARQITHRDIKLENVLYCNGQVKLIDFGFSTLFANSIKKKIYCGTPSYMAPEIVSKQYYRGPPADIWAFGVVIYYLTMGFFPFKGQNDKELFYLITQCDIDFACIEDLALQDLLFSMLQFDPQERITAAEVMLHPWFQDYIKPIKMNNKSSKQSCSKINSPRQIHPYQQFQSTVKKHDKASIEYQLDQSLVRRGVVQSYMSSVASNKSPIIRRRDSGNQTFDRSSNSKFVKHLIQIIRRNEPYKLALLKSSKNRSSKEENYICQHLQSYNYCRDMIQKEGEQKYQKFCEFLNLTMRKAGQVLLRKGDYGQRFYIILKGTVNLIYYNPKSPAAIRLLRNEQNVTPPYENSTLFQSYVFKELHAGEHFGDMALIDESHVSATVTCKTNCEFACMEKYHFWKFVGKQIPLMDKIKLLRQAVIFSSWSDSELRTLSYEFQFRKYHHNQIIFAQGQISHNMYIISNGFAELVFTKSNKQYSICRIDQGQIFGDDLNVYETTAKCGSPQLEIYVLSKQTLYKYFENRFELKQLFEEQSEWKKNWRMKRLEQLLQTDQNKQLLKFKAKSPQTIDKDFDYLKQLESRTHNASSQIPSVRRLSNHADNMSFEKKQDIHKKLVQKNNKNSLVSSMSTVEFFDLNAEKKKKEQRKKELEQQNQFMTTVQKYLQQGRLSQHAQKLQQIKSSRSFSQNQFGQTLHSPKSSMHSSSGGSNFFLTPRMKKQFLVQGIVIQR